MVRAFYQATKVENATSPYDVVTMKVFYPAGTPTESSRNTGVVPANESLAPFPIVIIMPGINVGAEKYQWLAEALAGQGMVVITFAWIAEEMPGFISLTPGVDLAALRPDTYGTSGTSPAIPAILNACANWHDKGVLAGLLDLDTVILGGHSAGGTMAMQNANPDWHPSVKAGFSYAAHTMASTFLGFEQGTILPLAPDVPLLIMGGTADGVIAGSSHRYGVESSPTMAMERTFDEAVKGGHDNVYLVFLDGANHFAMAHPEDPTTGRDFIDWPATRPGHEYRAILAEMIGLFITGHVHSNSGMRARPGDIDKLKMLLANSPLIATYRIK